MKINSKLTIIFLAISLIPVFVISLASINRIEMIMKNSIGANFLNLVEEKARSIDLVLEERIYETDILAAVKSVIGAIRESNLAYSNKPDLEIQNIINQIDKEWIDNRGATEKASYILNNELSLLFKSYQNKNPDRYGEIFLTDVKGATIAMTKKLSDYYQADESWWISTFNQGRGKVFIDDRGYDESVGALVLGIAVPVKDKGKIIGVLKINYRVKDIIDIVSAKVIGKTYEAFLFNTTGNMLYSSGGQLRRILSEAETALHNVPESSWVEDIQDGRKIIKAHAPIDLELSARVPSPGERIGILGERWEPSNWHLFIQIGQDEVFAPINKVKRLYLIIGVIVSIIVTISAYYFARMMSGPVKKLTEAAEIIGKGNLEHRVDIKTKDEIGRLAIAFNLMTEIRMRDEEELRRYQDSLEELVKERTAELEQTNKALAGQSVELHAVNQELEAFNYSVSHDLRAPLRGIDGFSKILLEDNEDQLDTQGRDYLRRVGAATQRMGNMIDDLLNLSKVTRAEMRREMVDLSALAKTITAELQQAEPDRGVTFLIAEGMVAKGDAKLLHFVLENLLGNAWKFTSKHPQATIELGVVQDDGEPTYVVRDNGAGFDMTYADKLFGPFQRLHRQEDFEGTGIGLATVQRIISRHGGEVWGEGEVGKGATFYFTLS